MFPLFDIFTFCTFFWKLHIFISRKEWIDSINYLVEMSIFLVFIIFFELAISTLSATLQAGDLIDQVDRERGVNRNQSRGIQLIYAKRLTHHPNTNYTLLVMDSCMTLFARFCNLHLNMYDFIDDITDWQKKSEITFFLKQ